MNKANAKWAIIAARRRFNELMKERNRQIGALQMRVLEAQSAMASTSYSEYIVGEIDDIYKVRH